MNESVLSLSVNIFEDFVSFQLVIFGTGCQCMFLIGYQLNMTCNKYRTWKMILSSGQAKGLLSEYQSKYTSARAVYRERKKYFEEIDWNMLAVPPTGSYKVIFFFSLMIL